MPLKSVSKWGLGSLGLLGWVLFVSLGGLIAYNSRGYFHAPTETGFFEEKAPISLQPAWQVSLVAHAAAGIVCMAASLLQFFRGVLRRWPWLHRHLGKIYAGSVLWVVSPTGFYLAWYAKGGWLGQTGFFVLGVLTFVFTWLGVREMKAGHTRAHARWMVRSFAMIATAITFRVAHMAFTYTSMAYQTNYLLSLWLSILGNAAVAELCVYLMPKPSSKPAIETAREQPVPALRRVAPLAENTRVS